MDYEYLDYLVEQVSQMYCKDEFLTEGFLGPVEKVAQRIKNINSPDQKILKYYEEVNQDLIPFRDLKKHVGKAVGPDGENGIVEYYTIRKSIVIFEAQIWNRDGEESYGFDMRDRIAERHKMYYVYAWGLSKDIFFKSSSEWAKSVYKEMLKSDSRHGLINSMHRHSSIGKTNDTSVSLDASIRGVQIKIQRSDLKRVNEDENEAIKTVKTAVKRVLPSIKKNFELDELQGFRGLIFSEGRSDKSLGFTFGPNRKDVDKYIKKQVANALDTIYVQYYEADNSLVFNARYNAFEPSDPNFLNGDIVDMIFQVDATTGKYIKKTKIYRARNDGNK